MSDNNKWWERRQETDYFVRKRNEMNVISRAFFKIEEIDKKFNLIKSNSDFVFDLGSAPGSWIQYFRRKTVNTYGIDLLPLKIKHEKFFQQDIEGFNTSLMFDLIASDIAPNLSGNRTVDQGKMCNIVEIIFKLVDSNLKENGHFVMKLFEGESTQLAVSLSKGRFKSFKIHKPKASRKESSETYLVCLSKK